MRRGRIWSALIPYGLIAILLCQSALAYQWGRSTIKTDEGDTGFTPGLLPTVKGSIQLTQDNPVSRLSSTRASRQLSYDYPARTAYRAGNIDYPTLSKIARERTRPVTPPPPALLRGRAQTGFAKNLPELYPYSAGSSLRQASAAKLQRPKPAARLIFEPESLRGEE